MDVTNVLLGCGAILLVTGVILHAWWTWPRSEEDRWAEPSSGFRAFGDFFDFFP